jgi:hypothetical protein
MKKTEKKLRLNRETLRILDDEVLGEPLGGIKQTGKTLPTPPTQVVCTATCN